MKGFPILLIFFVLFSCKKEEQAVAVTKTDPNALTFAQSKMQLIGKAQQEVIAWSNYERFKNLLENLDHTPVAAQNLYDAAQDLSKDIPEELNSQEVVSRIKLVITRAGIYNSYINYSNVDDNILVKKHADLIESWDMLTIIINEKINIYDKIKQETLEDLKIINQAKQPGTDSLDNNLPG
ncbi:MAG: hypothetical protein VX550_07840 [Bacteroidota bacterium]|nr:hypothetical protein [Bacteroidota bacterium]